jgi:hypothetical protein
MTLRFLTLSRLQHAKQGALSVPFVVAPRFASPALHIACHLAKRSVSGSTLYTRRVRFSWGSFEVRELLVESKLALRMGGVLCAMHVRCGWEGCCGSGTCEMQHL